MTLKTFFVFLFLILVDCIQDFSKCGKNTTPPHQIAINYEIGFWPWMASLGFSSEGEWYHQCGATLISQEHFITAAHCAKNVVKHSWKIRHGDNNLKKSFDNSHATDFEIEKIYIHPKYEGTAYYDIAILQIAPVKFSTFLRPICLPGSSNFKEDQYDDKTSTLIGWGSKDTTAEPSPTLKRTILRIYENSYCNETHENVFGNSKQRVETFLPHLFQPNILCAGYESSEQGSCSGDSGGPLMFFKPRLMQFFQVGLVSGGVSNKCGDINVPSYFTRLDHPEIYDFLTVPDIDDEAGLTKLLVAFGWSDDPKNIEIINLREKDDFPYFFEYLANDLFSTKVAYSSATGQLFKGKMPIICEGSDTESCFSCHAYYNNSWNFLPGPEECSRSFATSAITSAILTNNDGEEVLYIAGGFNSESLISYDGLVWEKTENNGITVLDNHCLVKIDSSTLLFVGGRDKNGQAQNNTYIYDVQFNQWTSGPPLTIPRYGVSCGILKWKNPESGNLEKIVVAAGGHGNQSEHFSSVELLVLNDDDEGWVTGPELPNPISFAPMTEFKNSVILIAGSDLSSESLEVFHFYRLSSPNGAWMKMKKTMHRKSGKPVLAFLVPDITDITDINDITDITDKTDETNYHDPSGIRK